jgi:hypothetical protein
MNSNEVRECININIKKAIHVLKITNQDMIYDFLVKNSYSNHGLSYSLTQIDKLEINLMIIKNIQSSKPSAIKINSVLVAPEVEKEPYRDGDRVIQLNQLCENLGIREKIPHYDVFDNKKICAFIEEIKSKGFIAQWKNSNDQGLALFISMPQSLVP